MIIFKTLLLLSFLKIFSTNYEWSNWDTWSKCERLCIESLGIKTRKRECCKNGRCNSSSFLEYIPCIINPIKEFNEKSFSWMTEQIICYEGNKSNRK